MTRVLVAIDETAPSLAALQWADEFVTAQGGGDIAEALHIWKPMEGMTPDGSGIIVESTYPLTSEQLLENALGTVDASHFEGVVGSGRTVQSILVAAQEFDLLVIGTRAQGPVRQSMFGSVSQSVVADAQIPVVVVPDPASKDGPVVVAWDGTVGAQSALNWVIAHGYHDVLAVYFDDGREVAPPGRGVRFETRPGDSNTDFASADMEASLLVMGQASSTNSDESRWGSATTHAISTAVVPIIVVPPTSGTS